MKLIGIHGRKRSGKDTTARFIREVMPELQLIAFADRLKEVCSVYFGVPLHYFYDERMKDHFYPEFQLTVREMMTSMSDHLKRGYGLYIWLRPVRQRYEELKADGAYGLVVTDVRYEYEAEWIRSEGGAMCHVSNSRTDSGAGEHSSEQGIQFLSGDASFLNEGSMAYLQTQVHTFAAPFKMGV